MRSLALSLIAVLVLAVGVAPRVQADPIQDLNDAYTCLMNAILGQWVVGAPGCVQHLAADAPLCAQVYDSATGTTLTFPCGLTCEQGSHGWVVVVGVQGLPGNSVTGALMCNGATALSATATATLTGTGFGYAYPSPPNSGTATCGLTGTLPTTVSVYAVFCVTLP